MDCIGTWARETQRHISTQVHKARRHVKNRDQIWVGMVGDGLDWV